MMWDIVRAILISYSIIVVLEYVLKAVFVRQQSAASTLSPETRKMIEQKLMEQYKRYDEIGEDPLSVYGRGLPKRKGIGF